MKVTVAWLMTYFAWDACQVRCCKLQYPLQVHLAWIKTPRNKGGLGHIKIPILADVKKASPCSHPYTRLLLIASGKSSAGSPCWLCCPDCF